MFIISKQPVNDSLVKEYANVFKGLGNVEGEYLINLHHNAKRVIHPHRKVTPRILAKRNS